MSPSPTGYFHVGSARTALYNWLIAHQQGGTFVLRIEDTDDEREREGATEGILRVMEWLDLRWDEGPYFQSQRGDLYTAAAEKLYASGMAYYCDCTSEEVQRRAKERGGPPGYDSFCRERGLGPGPGRVLRFSTPDTGETVVVDLVRGEPVTQNEHIEDFALVRSNGRVLFILANVVDDIDMEISHVIRGEDHLPNTPKYLLLWDALQGGPHPVFAHLPLLVNERRQKISKRKGDKVAVEDYQSEGYLPDAFRNYVALLGWAPSGDREIISIEEMIAEFRLEDVVPSPAFFDEKKLQHINSEYIRARPLPQFIAEAEAFLPSDWDADVFERIAEVVQTRVRTLGEVPGMVRFLFEDPPARDDKAWDKRVVRAPSSAEILDLAISGYAACTDWSAEGLKAVAESVAERVELGLGKAQFPIRVAVTGSDVGPPLFESLEVLGRERTLERLRKARADLERL
jgi:glutamyl-tRNA synthetase